VKEGRKKVWKVNGKTQDYSKMKEWGFLIQSREQNNLPIVNIKLFEGKPCLDPTEEEIPSRSDNFFPSMNRMISGGCKFDSIRKKVYDDRYQATGLKIS